MRKLKVLFIAIAIGFIFQSCATVFGGRVSECQRTRPAVGQPAREIRPVALIFDVLGGLVWVAVDFATGAIYKPCDTPKK